MAKYLLKPVLNTVKQDFNLEDESGKTVYEGKMTKFSLFGASPFEFANHVTGRTEVHKVGKTVTVEVEVPASALAFVGNDGKWRLEKGDFRISCGGQSAMVKCTKTKVWDEPNI